MTTAATSTPVSMASNAAFQAWYNEQITQLTAVGLTQTADTGQIGATAVIPAANTSAGYTIWRFNDTLQSTAPIFIKLEFGAGALPGTEPQMWVTVGTGSNGSGTLTGVTTTRVVVLSGQPPASGVTNYTSRWCYSATDGFLGMVFKIGSLTNANTSLGSFFIYRGNTTGGVSAGDAFILLTSGSAATPTSGGYMQCYSYASAAIFPTLAAANSSGWIAAGSGSSGAGMPFNLTATLVGGVTAYVTPTYYMNPNLNFSAFTAVALLSEIPLGTTATFAIIGSGTHTFIAIGNCFGIAGTIGSAASAAGLTFLMIWE